MKKFRKAWLLLMMLVMVLSIGLSSSLAATKIDKETGLPYMADYTKKITFNIFVRDPGQAPAKTNPVLKKITQLTGVTINYEFLVGDLNQKIGVMIAGEDYPDAIFCGDQNTKFIEAGAFIPLETKLKKYPRLSAHYAPYLKYMTAKDGHIYNLQIYGVNCKPAPIFENGGAGFFMQKAVIEENGYKIPHTIDEYFQMIENYKAKHPEIDGVKTIGFEILCDGWRDFCLRNPAQHLMGASNDGDVFVDTKTYTAMFYQNTDTAKTYYKKLNEEFNKGIIEPETFTQSYDQYISRLSTGAVLGMFDQAWNFNYTAGNVLRSDKKYNRTYISVPIANPGVKDSYLDAPSETIDGINGIGITKKCKNPDRLLAFYEWLMRRDVQDYLRWGVEGKDWKKAGANDKVLTPERRALNQDSAKQRDLTGATLVNYSPKPEGLYEDGSPTEPRYSPSEFKAASSEYDIKFLTALKINYPAQILSPPVKRPAYYPVWAYNIEDGSKAKVVWEAMKDVCRKAYPRLIMAKPAEFDSLWEKFLEDFKASNPQAYLDEVNKQIKARMNIK
ncbi:MAG: sugar ABC transporter substrate-binding protein [Firmicutes bacterium]|nr:sugar ABC transporter substrate-binding protein [Bacillota bacterium]